MVAQLENGQAERQRIQVLRLMSSDLTFSPYPSKFRRSTSPPSYNDDLLPGARGHHKAPAKARRQGLSSFCTARPAPAKPAISATSAASPISPSCSFRLAWRCASADPEFINLLHDNANSILLIEDAEELLTKRSATGSNAVSNLLNLSDGLLSDGFHIQIVCTFNADLTAH
ncbi:MAG: hypothetical protein WKG07_02960 [Hymenobacter sp.]